jgi:nucleotide-binding universal stress UspA family protein
MPVLSPACYSLLNQGEPVHGIGAVVARARISSIFHPSDLSRSSEVAFAHALKIALATHSVLHMLHVESRRAADWSDMPAVRGTLERWGLIAPGSPRSSVRALGIDVGKIVSTGRPVQACLRFLKKTPADLIVLAVRQRAGRMRWLEKKTGEPIARRAGEMTLFIPYGADGFVSLACGEVTLRSVLIPVDRTPSAMPAVHAVARLIQGLGLAEGQVTLLHVGPREDMPSIVVPRIAGSRWKTTCVDGDDPAELIAYAAMMKGVDLIAMTTEGPNGFLDALRGSTSERVLNRASCPLLCLPAHAQTKPRAAAAYAHSSAARPMRIGT